MKYESTFKFYKPLFAGRFYQVKEKLKDLTIVKLCYCKYDLQGIWYEGEIITEKFYYKGNPINEKQLFLYLDLLALID